MPQVKLSELLYEHFEIVDTWRVIEASYEETDLQLEPATKNQYGEIEITNGEVWCLCKAIFNDNSIHKASAMCRSDNEDGPLLWSFWNGIEDVPLFLPPAPDFVLAKEGIISFCEKFRKNSNEIFPIKLIVNSIFQFPPRERAIEIENKVI